MSKTSSYTGALFAWIDGQHYMMEYTAAEVNKRIQDNSLLTEMLMRKSEKIEEQRTRINALESLKVALQSRNKQQSDTIQGLLTDAIQTQSAIEEQRETIKGLDRAGQRYKEIIEQYRKEMRVLQAKVHEMEEKQTKGGE